MCREVCDWGPVPEEQTEGELAMPLGGQRTVCGSLPGTPTLPLFLHLSSLAPGIFLIILHTSNLAPSSQPFSNLQVEPHGNKERARGRSPAPPHDCPNLPLKTRATCLQQSPAHHSRALSLGGLRPPGRPRRARRSEEGGEVREQGQDSEAETNVRRPNLGLCSHQQFPCALFPCPSSLPSTLPSSSPSSSDPPPHTSPL